MYWLAEALAFLRVPELWIGRIQLVVSLAVILTPLPVLVAFHYWSRPRQAVLPPYRERVVILGASSGVGRALALAYAARGCRHLVIVGRRQKELDEVADLCREHKRKGEAWEMSQEAPGWETDGKGQGPDGIPTPASSSVTAVQADCATPEGVFRVRQECRRAYKGVDTLHICFGVSALRPLLGIAGVDPVRPMPRAELGQAQSLDTTASRVPLSGKQQGLGELEADLDGLKVVEAAHRRIDEVNAVATSVVLTAFLPMMQTTSPSPSIHLLSSAAAVFPAPTRALYCASKAAQLAVFQSVAIEAASQAKLARKPGSLQQRAHVRFYASLPGTILSDFRASAVDGSPAASAAFDGSWDAAKGGKAKKSDALQPTDVADRSILALDRYVEGAEEMPAKYWLARKVQPFAPSLIVALARKKYGY